MLCRAVAVGKKIRRISDQKKDKVKIEKGRYVCKHKVRAAAMPSYLGYHQFKEWQTLTRVPFRTENTKHHQPQSVRPHAPSNSGNETEKTRHASDRRQMSKKKEKYTKQEAITRYMTTV